MIIIIEGSKYKQLIIKAVSMLSLVIMFGLYYQHMSDKFSQQNNDLMETVVDKEQKKVDSKTVKIEKTIYKESVTIVNLIDQKKVQSIKIIKDRLLIICDYDTDIEPVIVRYGVAAMVKNTSKNIKIAIDLRTIVENKYES